jgi:phosphate transport system protein
VKEHFAEQVERVRRELIVMGSEGEKQIRGAVNAVNQNSTELARQVIARDSEIDELENRIEESVIALFALQQPVAIDLRLLIGVLKINNDLERIGDHAVNIAEGAERMSALRTAKPNVDIDRIAELATAMLSDALAAFIHRDAALAREVIRRDDTLDARNQSLIRELLTYMAETPSMISRGLELISISKNLERVGDLATNIAEDTIFIAEARQVKHHAV